MKRLIVATVLVLFGGWCSAQVNGQGVLSVNGVLQGGSGTTDHALLSHLDYASALHTGFAPLADATFTGNTTATTFRLFDGGTHYTIFQAQTQGANYTYTLPALGNVSGALTNDGTGELTWEAPAATGADTALSNLASVAINTALLPGADGSIALGSTAFRFSNVYAGTAFSIYKAVSEANPTATLGNGVLNFGAGTTNAVDVGLKRSSGGVLYVTDGSSGAGDLNAHGLVIADTTMVTNLNADTVDGSHGSAFATVALDNLASVAINAAVNPGADNGIAIGTSALRFTTISASTGFSIFKAASEANPTATLGNGVLNFGAGTTNAVDIGVKRDAAGVLEVTNGSTGYGSLQASSAALVAAGVLNWSSTTDPAGTPDVGISRNGPGELNITNGSSGYSILAAEKFTLNQGSGGGLDVAGTAADGILRAWDTGTDAMAFEASVLTRTSPTTDAAPASSVLKSANAFPGATGGTNTVGANTILAGGIGQRIFSVVDYTQLAGTTVTITVNGVATVKTENVDWYDTTSNGAVAISLASAIDGITGVSASAATNDVRIVPDVGTYSLTIAKTAADAGMTATSGADGHTYLPGMLDLGSKGYIVPGANYTPGSATFGAIGYYHSAYDDGAEMGGMVTVGTTIPDADGWIKPNGNFGANLILARGRVGLMYGGQIKWCPYSAYDFTDPNAGITSTGAGLIKITDGSTGSGNIEASTAITAVGTAAYNGVIRTGVYKRAWTNAEVAGLSGKDAELKVATLPAKTIVRNAYVVVDTNETHLSDLTVALGRTGALYVDYIVASNTKAETLGGELVTNGTFTGNANGWTLGGAGGAPDWHFDTDHVDRDTGGGTGTLTPSTPLVAVIGTQYKLQWTMAGFSAGTCTASFGGVTGIAQGSDATFTEYFTATSTATLAFTPTNDFVGSVDTVILKEVARTIYGATSGERGVNLTGYDLPSYTAVTDVYLNFVTTDGSHTLADALQSTGTVYLMTEVLP